MPAVMRPHRVGGSFRLGHECFHWGDDFTRALSYEVDEDICIIGGLTSQLEPIEYRWLAAHMIENSWRPAIERVVRGVDGQPLRNPDGTPILRRRMMPMPNRPRR